MYLPNPLSCMQLDFEVSVYLDELINPGACVRDFAIFPCVNVSVCVCFRTSFCIPPLYVENKVSLSFLWHFLNMYCVDFVETLGSEVMATFDHHLCLLCFLTDFRWTT